MSPIFRCQESKKAIAQRAVAVAVDQKGAVLILFPCLHTRGSVSNETLEPRLLWIVWDIQCILIILMSNWSYHCLVEWVDALSCHPLPHYLQFHCQKYLPRSVLAPGIHRNVLIAFISEKCPITPQFLHSRWLLREDISRLLHFTIWRNPLASMFAGLDTPSSCGVTWSLKCRPLAPSTAINWK
jgi:hypothetical protein